MSLLGTMQVNATKPAWKGTYDSCMQGWGSARHLPERIWMLICAPSPPSIQIFHKWASFSSECQKRHFTGIPVPPDSSGLTSIAKFSLSTPEWNVYSKSHPNHQVASSLMLHWWKRFVWEFSLSTGSQNSTKGQLPSTSQYHSFSVKPANRKHSARANTRKAKEKAPSPWFGLLLGSLESETQNKKHRLKSPDRSKAEKMFSQILVKWNYPISQSFTCKQKWRALRTALRMNWKLYQVAPTGSPCCSAFIARSSVPFLLFPSLNCLDTSLQTIQRFRLKCILVTHALLSAGT